jgi:Tfp pilus assembly protein PilV
MDSGLSATSSYRTPVRFAIRSTNSSSWSECGNASRDCWHAFCLVASNGPIVRCCRLSQYVHRGGQKLKTLLFVRSPSNKVLGFTLVEVLISIAVLVMALVLVSQLTSGISSLTMNANKRSDADGQARLVFNRLAADISKMVRRADVDYLFSKQTGNDSISFYSEYFGSGSNTTDPTISVVGYRINNVASQGAQLERGAENRTWSTVTYAFSNTISAQRLVTSVTNPTTLPSINGVNYQALADQVFRFEFCFLLCDGSLSTSYYNNSITNQLAGTHSPTPNDSSSLGYQTGSWWSQPNVADYVCTGITSGLASWKKTNKLSNIEAIVAAIAVLDNKRRVILPTSGGAPDLSPLVNVLPDAVDGQDIASTWNAIVNRQNNNVAYPPAGVPQAAAIAVRVYQASFRLGTPH